MTQPGQLPVFPTQGTQGRGPRHSGITLALVNFIMLAGVASGGAQTATNAIRQVPGTPPRLRTDLSATLFFAGPAEYDGGELCVEDTYGVCRACRARPDT